MIILRNSVVFFGIIIFFILLSLVVTNTAFMVTDKIYSGVVVGDISVGGLSIREAEDKIRNSVEWRIANASITMKYNDEHWKFAADDIELIVDAAELARQAFNIGRQGSIFQQLRERYITINSGYKIPLFFTFNHEKFQSITSDMFKQIERKPCDAKIILSGSKLIKKSSENGRKVDMDRLIVLLQTNLNEGVSAQFSIPVIDIEPKIKTSDLEEIDSIMTMYTTQFDSTNEDRVQNIVLASKSISDTLLRPGEVFSFNHHVGARIAEHGYREAPVMVDGRVITDFGGGVCQVSSTLYNAILLADLKIEERTSHFRPPGYVPIGQDATVADHLLDLKFKNVLPHNVYILSEVYDGNITIYVLGKSNPERPEIVIETVDKKIVEPNTIVKQDANLEYGKQIIESHGQKGFVVSTYRVKKVGGKEIQREYLFTDEFLPEDRVVRIGTRVDHKNAMK